MSWEYLGLGSIYHGRSVSSNDGDLGRPGGEIGREPSRYLDPQTSGYISKS